MRIQERTLPRRLDLLNDSKDQDVFILGNLGWTGEAIAHKTGLTEGQVNYRLKAWGISRMDYRRGEGVAKLAFNALKDSTFIREPLGKIAQRQEEQKAKPHKPSGGLKK